VQSWTAAGSKIQQKIQSQCLHPQIEICFLIYIHRETSKFKQSVLILVSPVSSTGIRNNNIICMTPTMILYEDMKPIEHVLLHPICVLYYLMCACKHCNIKLSLYYRTHWSCWWVYHFKKKQIKQELSSLSLDTQQGRNEPRRRITIAHLFQKVHLLPKDLRFEHGGAKLVLGFIAPRWEDTKPLRIQQ